MTGKHLDLSVSAQFSPEGPVKTDLIQTAGSKIVIVCLEEGQVIPPHPEPYAVVFVVLEGEGVITSGRDQFTVRPMHLISVEKGEDRGIECVRRLILLGIREDLEA